MTKKRLNSRAKGQVGERELAKKFTAWWGLPFSRSPASGAFATVHSHRSDLNMAGDLTVQDSRFPWCIEVKRVEGVSLEQLLTAPASLMYSWWEQANRSADQENKIPILVFRKNSGKWLFILPKSKLNSFTADTLMYCSSVKFKEDIVIGLLEDLFNKSKPEDWYVKNEFIKISPTEFGKDPQVQQVPEDPPPM